MNRTSDRTNGHHGTSYRRKTRTALLALAVLLGAGLLLMAQWAERPGDTALGQALADAQVDPQPKLAIGLALYQTNCLSCHGQTGRGDGPAAYLLYPRPRDFGEGNFRISSTMDGMPSDADLLRVLRSGMPGSAMPPFNHLADEQLDALVETVKHLALQGKADDLIAANPRTSEARAAQLAQRLLAPGMDIDLPPHPGPQAINLQRGKELFIASCVDCHGQDGRGRDRTDLLDSSGLPILARDFTRGIFKGGGEAEDLAMRIVRGMPGTPMPANSLSAEDLWSLVAYVQGLVELPPGADYDMSQRPLTAMRVPGPIGSGLDQPDWDGAPTVTLPVAPLWWRDERIESVRLSALHDGRQIALRLSWNDAAADDSTAGHQAFSDALAIQLSNTENPPFFGMGEQDGPVDIWYWRASRWQQNGSGVAALRLNSPNMPPNDWQTVDEAEPAFPAARGAGNPMAQSPPPGAIDALRAVGFGTLTPLPPTGQLVTAEARRTEQGWQVVFVRPLTGEPGGHVPLKPGEPVSIAFAVWDGQAGDRNGQKSVTAWHRLTLE